jgi:hypothetical protein
VTEIPPGARLRATRDEVSCTLEGDVVILNFADQVYYGLDGVGARVWELLREPRTLAELRDVVATEYEVDSATAERDLRELLEELAGRRLVEVLPAGAA